MRIVLLQIFLHMIIFFDGDRFASQIIEAADETKAVGIHDHHRIGNVRLAEQQIGLTFRAHVQARQHIQFATLCHADNLMPGFIGNDVEAYPQSCL